MVLVGVVNTRKMEIGASDLAGRSVRPNTQRRVIVSAFKVIEERGKRIELHLDGSGFASCTLMVAGLVFSAGPARGLIGPGLPDLLFL